MCHSNWCTSGAAAYLCMEGCHLFWGQVMLHDCVRLKNGDAPVWPDTHVMDRDHRALWQHTEVCPTQVNAKRRVLHKPAAEGGNPHHQNVPNLQCTATVLTCGRKSPLPPKCVEEQNCCCWLDYFTQAWPLLSRSLLTHQQPIIRQRLLQQGLNQVS